MKEDRNIHMFTSSSVHDIYSYLGKIKDFNNSSFKLQTSQGSKKKSLQDLDPQDQLDDTMWVSWSEQTSPWKKHVFSVSCYIVSYFLQNCELVALTSRDPPSLQLRGALISWSLESFPEQRFPGKRSVHFRNTYRWWDMFKVQITNDINF